MASFAVAAIARDEGRYVAEWAVFHLLAGAERVLVYDNGSTDGMAAILQALSRHVAVDVVHWPTRARDFNATQKLAYADAARRLAGMNFVAFIDVDEFLVVDPGLTIAGVLDGYGPGVGAIACQQVLFGSSGADRASDDLVMARFTRSAPTDYPGHVWFKTIARPALLQGMETVHSVHTSGLYVHADGSPLERGENPRHALTVHHRPIRLHHYIVKSREEFAAKQARMLAADLPESVRAGYTDQVAGFDARVRLINQVENLDLARHAPAVRERLREVSAAPIS